MKKSYQTIKTGFSILLVCLMIIPAQGQSLDGDTFSLPLSEPSKPGKLRLHLVTGSIKVTGYDKKEVQILANRRESHSKSRRKERDGMKSIGTNNLEFQVEEHDNTVVVRTWSGGAVDFEVKVPRDFSLNVKTVNRGDILVENVAGEFEVSNTNGAITMNNISGSVVADAVNKDIKVRFTSINNSPMAFSNFNGDIDLTFPGNLKADIKAKTQNGEIFTDFEVDLVSNPTPVSTKNEKTGAYKITRNEWVTGSVNGGGPEIVFQTWQGDILIRNKDK